MSERDDQDEFEVYLKVFKERSELVSKDAKKVFVEGKTSQAALLRYTKVQAAFRQNYLENRILYCRDNISKLNFRELEEKHVDTLEKLVASVTSEVGRALIGLSVMQLAIKAIEPQQSIRLHKSSASSNSFSWAEGLSMRSLDKKYVTPTLRKYNLLKLNADGFMMTRSLAENYPYSSVYKAQIRGARREWLDIVEWVEAGEMSPEPALDCLLAQLLNRADAFKALAARTLQALAHYVVPRPLTSDLVFDLLTRHMETSGYAARLMEIMMHSLLQAAQEVGVFGGAEVKPLSQMRSANKKHGNIGDVEVFHDGEIIEAWDAKYGKDYLRDQLEELNDKLSNHTEVAVAGFVTTETPRRREELEERLSEVAEFHNVSLYLLSLKGWVQRQVERALASGLVTENDLAKGWLTAYVESLAQMRREIAPIDEPCYHWLESLEALLNKP